MPDTSAHVGHEAGHPGVREAAGEAPDGLGLAGAGGSGDQAVPVQHGQRHRDLEAGVDLLALDRPAQPDRGHVECVTVCRDL
jgi:hypothetical protein